MSGDDGRETPPKHLTRARKSDFIVDNADVLNPEAKRAILDHVMMEVVQEGKSEGSGEGQQPLRDVVIENERTKHVSIRIDAIKNPAVIDHIYNIVWMRREALDRPATGRGCDRPWTKADQD